MLFHKGVIHTRDGAWHSPDTNPELQTKTQSLQSLGKFKALDTSSKIRACEEIKSQMKFSQPQGCLFLALFPKPSPCAGVAHVGCTLSSEPGRLDVLLLSAPGLVPARAAAGW